MPSKCHNVQYCFVSKIAMLKISNLQVHRQEYSSTADHTEHFEIFADEDPSPRIIFNLIRLTSTLASSVPIFSCQTNLKLARTCRELAEGSATHYESVENFQVFASLSKYSKSSFLHAGEFKNEFEILKKRKVPRSREGSSSQL